MIAQPTIGKYLKGLLEYNTSKEAIGEGRFIHSNNPSNSLSEYVLHHHTFTANHQNVNNILHLSLNFPKEDHPLLTTSMYTTLATDFLSRYGFPDHHPFAVFEHGDKNHPHIHIITPLIKEDGKAINDSHMVRKMIKISREMEIEYGLTKVSKRDLSITPKLAEAADFETNFKATEYAVRTAMKNKPGSLKELQKNLDNQFITYNGQECRVTYQLSKQHNGISFLLTDKEGTQIAKGIKGSKFPNLSFNSLTKSLAYNEKVKESKIPAVKKLFMQALQESFGQDLNAFNKALEKRELRANYYYSKSGDVFGMDVLDYKTNMIFKASELGKELSWNKIKPQFKTLPTQVNTDTQTNSPINQNQESNMTKPNTITIKDLKESVNLIDLAEHLGYRAVIKKHGKGSLFYENGDDKIIIYPHEYVNAAMKYTTCNNPHDGGDVINLLINKGVCSDFKAAIQYLKESPAIAPSITPSLSRQPVKEQTVKEFVAIPTESCKPDTYIVKNRSVPYQLLKSRFADSVLSKPDLNRNSNYTNTIFPLTDIRNGELVGQMERGRNYKHILEGSNKTFGMWESSKIPGAPTFILEDPLDAISHQALNPNLKANYVATCGSPSLQIINYIADKINNGENIVLAGDNDVSGQHFNMLFTAAAISRSSDSKVIPNQFPEQYTLNYEGLDSRIIDLHFKAIEGLTVADKKITVDSNKLKLEFSKTPETIFEAVKSLASVYGMKNLDSIKPEMKDFNDMLQSLSKQQQKNNLSI